MQLFSRIANDAGAGQGANLARTTDPGVCDTPDPIYPRPAREGSLQDWSIYAKWATQNRTDSEVCDDAGQNGRHCATIVSEKMQHMVAQPLDNSNIGA